MINRPNKFFDNILPIITIIILPLFIVFFGYVVYSGHIYKQEQEIKYNNLEKKFEKQLNLQTQANASTSFALNQAIKIIENNLMLTKSESLSLSKAISETVSKEQQKVASLQETTEKIGGTVDTLEKLRQIDEEILKKYSKVFFLNENYVPKKLSEIKNMYLYSERKTQYLSSDVLPFLTNMLDEAYKQNIKIYVKSAYRSFNEQDNLKNEYTLIYGENTANQFSADQGYSEHQLGTTVDFVTSGMKGELKGFEKTEAFKWLSQNGYKYGFILSYTENNKFYIYEPWHFRFVGRTLSKKLYEENKHFYDIDQREIDKYLVSIFD